jgi:hypothetical protein
MRFNGLLELLRHSEGGPGCSAAGVDDDVRKGSINGLNNGGVSKCGLDSQNKLGLGEEKSKPSRSTGNAKPIVALRQGSNVA